MRKILLLFFTLLFCSSVMASPVKEIVFFGDSLSDDGNLLQKLKIIPKSPPYYKGRFSNGITWAEHLGNYLYEKSYVKYSNYCYGGATAILHTLRTDKFIAPMLLEEELDAYFLQTPFKDKSQSAYALWIGANDYLYDTTPDVNGLTNKVVNKIIDSADRLLRKGAHGILIINLPDLSLTPHARIHQNVARLHELSYIHKVKLDAAIKILSAKYPNKVLYVDIYTLFNEIMSNPEKYNQKYNTHITETTQSCWLGTIWGVNSMVNKKALEDELKAADVDQMNSETILLSPALREAYTLGQTHDNGKIPCNNADQYIFWDDLHPTAVVHKVLGKIIIDELENNKWLS